MGITGSTGTGKIYDFLYVNSESWHSDSVLTEVRKVVTAGQEV